MVEVKNEEFVDVKIEPESKPSDSEETKEIDNQTDSQPLADVDNQDPEPTSDEDKELDDSGVSYKNRYIESERKRKNLEEENDVYRKQYTPAPSPPPQPAYNQPVQQQPANTTPWAEEHKTLTDEYLRTGMYDERQASDMASGVIKTNQSMLASGVNFIKDTYIKPMETRSLDAIQEAKIETMVAKNPELADFSDEAMKILRVTPTERRNQKGVINDAFALARGRGIDSIKEKATEKGRGEAIKEKRIVKEVSSPGAMRADKSGNVRMTAKERDFLEKSAGLRGITFQEALKQNIAIGKTK